MLSQHSRAKHKHLQPTAYTVYAGIGTLPRPWANAHGWTHTFPMEVKTKRKKKKKTVLTSDTGRHLAGTSSNISPHGYTVAQRLSVFIVCLFVNFVPFVIKKLQINNTTMY